jgi:hypothetical protein
MARTTGDLIADVAITREEFAARLAELEASGNGNSDFASRCRDYIRAADKLIAAARISERPV